ncbi:MAG: HAD-IA family hydrolase [Salaquimonas sp.]|nr:HAD-IA family hydrolase [Salaquimonas sp.]
MPASPPLLVLDLDGTLADTSRDLLPVLNRVTAKVGLPPIGMENVGQVVGHGAKAMIARAFAFHDQQADDGLVDRLFDDFLVDYEANIAVNTVLYEGAAQALDRFAENGWRLAVCTNKLEHLARQLLDALGQSGRFAAITGGDTFDYRKPDPRHLTRTVALAGGAPGKTIMVGDSITDITTARSAQIPVIAVEFGYSDIPADELGADRVIARFAELWQVVGDLTADVGW